MPVTPTTLTLRHTRGANGELWDESDYSVWEGDFRVGRIYRGAGGVPGGHGSG